MKDIELVGKEIVVNDSGKAGWVAEVLEENILISLYEEPQAVQEVTADAFVLTEEQEVPEEFYAVDLSSESGEMICSIRLEASNPVYASEFAKGQEHFEDFLRNQLYLGLESAIADLDTQEASADEVPESEQAAK